MMVLLGLLLSVCTLAIIYLHFSYYLQYFVGRLFKLYFSYFPFIYILIVSPFGEIFNSLLSYFPIALLFIPELSILVSTSFRITGFSLRFLVFKGDGVIFFGSSLLLREVMLCIVLRVGLTYFGLRFYETVFDG